MKPLFFLSIFVLITTIAFSQKKDSTWTGAAKGIVRDSIHDYNLPAATLAVYLVKDSSLISYQLSNGFGEFHFTTLPVKQPLRIVVSYMGYRSFAKKFIIADDEVDLKMLNLERGENSLKEVEVIAVPPVQMNGDTLEFNADAFRLDPNAQTEDLLRVLPGVTLWGDGTITINGREVKSVLVDGKPFFGGDKRVATQNIPKDAVDKIQVYQKSKDPKHALDSTTEINIKLKANKRMGHFGKVAAGYGSDERFEADASLNFFSPGMQLGIVGAANNINKEASSTDELLRNSTFKGVGAGTEYQSRFNASGINQPRSGGVVFQRDFIPNPDYSHENRLNMSYFLKNNLNDVASNLKTITSLGKDSSLVQEDQSGSQSTNTSHRFSSRYDILKDYNRFYAGAALNADITNNNSNSESSVYNSGNVLQSTNHERNQSNSDAKSLILEIGTKHITSKEQRNRRPRQYDIAYSFVAAGNNNDKLQQSQFTMMADPTQNKLFDRRYNTRANDTKQHLVLGVGDLAPWIFGRWLQSIRMELYNGLDVNTHHETNEVADKDGAKDTYILNRYLTNDSRYTTVDEKPALNLSRSFSKWLPNRYSKNLTIQMSAQAQFYQLQNHSDRDFQNINRSYQRFIPTADISYNNYQMGAFADNYSVKFAASSQYPISSQLVPLVDSANQYYIQYGNVDVKPADKKELSFNFSHYTIDRHNDFNYNIGVDIGMINNSFADSSITDQQGRSRHYLVNADGNRYLNGRANVSKSFKLKNHQLQISVNAFLQMNRTPNSIGGIWNTSNNRISNSQLQLYYSFKDIFSAILVQRFAWYHSKQDGINANELHNRTNETSFSASANCTKRLSLSSNINFNQNKASQSAAINFTIWNAYASYRFMKGNNLELKLSAMDLLHQNTSIVNYGSVNVIRYGTTSVLQQYFMTTVVWYPRKFGKKNTAVE